MSVDVDISAVPNSSWTVSKLRQYSRQVGLLKKRKAELLERAVFYRNNPSASKGKIIRRMHLLVLSRLFRPLVQDGRQIYVDFSPRDYSDYTWTSNVGREEGKPR